MTKRRVTSTIIILLFALLLGTGIYAYRTIKSVPQMFKLNEQCKSEGYYMADFEFKMLGCAYYLDKGQYITAFSRLSQLQQELKTREGLIKIPEFRNSNEELEFYLTMQNPKTGAFMDESYPIFTYIGPTRNVLEHIEYLCKESDQPLQLKYPLRFIDEINSPETLKYFLDDISTLGWIGAKFRPPFVEAAEMIGLPADMERTGLYQLSEEWNKALLQWFYDNQDSKTGYWGPRLRSSGELLNSGDLVSSEKVLKLFINRKGENLHSEFPLRYKDEIFSTTLQKLREPMPQDLSEVHDWTLVMNRGTRILTRYLWSSASPEHVNEAKDIVEHIIIEKYQKTYVPQQGAFSYYPGAGQADLDGTGETLSYLIEVGSFSLARQNYLWGSRDKSIKDLGTEVVSELRTDDFTMINNTPGVNSLRVYDGDPGSDYSTHIVGVIYPRETLVLDAWELLPRVSEWVNGTPQSLGNWVSKGLIKERLAEFRIQAVPAIFTGNIPTPKANQILKDNGQVIIVAFDVLQRPISKVVWKLK